jgi:hypothetical protein
VKYKYTSSNCGKGENMLPGKTIKKIIFKILKDDLTSGKVVKVNEYTYEYKQKSNRSHRKIMTPYNKIRS